MSEDINRMVIKTEIAKPPHHQQLEKSLNIEPFLTYVEKFLQQPLGDDGDVSSSSEAELVGVDAYTGETIWNGVATTKQDRRADKMRLYNLSEEGLGERGWISEILLSDTSSEDEDGEEITEEDLKEMLRHHLLRKKYKAKFYSEPKNHQYQYYSCGLLSTYDKFPEHQLDVIGIVRKKKAKRVGKKLEDVEIGQDDNQEFESESIKEEALENMGEGGSSSMSGVATGLASRLSSIGMQRGRRPGKRKAAQIKNQEIMAHKRRKIWAVMSKKELGKVQRLKLNNHKEMLTSCRRVANYCMRHWRQKAMQSQKNMKEVVWRAKRLTREMQVYWKRYERVERESRRRAERAAEEQRKLDVELMEAKRQQRKLNFLITQTELYAHFMSHKLGGASTQEQLRILSQLEENDGHVHPRLSTLDNYDSEMEKEKVKKRVEKAFSLETARAKEFEGGSPVPIVSGDQPQPEIFRGKLKAYQLKGMNWLVNLYDQGINGILADEMGLGKTVQSIAFLCHIAEKYSVWGPFLIISPASTLHNWQQEMQRFVPDFKVVPYWGNPQERKILRQFWDQKGLHTKGASFHVVITSYQLVITDFKYFNRIKWQYMILDEAQAIKSTSSMRWKLLLGFNCRNRLLLSGTPIQNSMAELWALLHFIMPTMFDSHDEFNEWFSKDIESHAENKTSIDEKHLSRLHMILKPFMLRRIKMDVENELSDKIEIMMYCPLTTRQKSLYTALKKKIKIEDLLHSAGPYQSAQSITSNLMNLVMQFRKVCNHPELFERREAWSPLLIIPEDYIVPRLIAEWGLIHRGFSSRKHILYNLLSIFAPENIHRSLFCKGWEFSSNINSSFSFSQLVKMSPMELHRLTVGGLLYRWRSLKNAIEDYALALIERLWNKERTVKIQWAGLGPLISTPFCFTSPHHHTFCHSTIIIAPIVETMEQKLMRMRNSQSLKFQPPEGKVYLPQVQTNEAVQLPKFINCSTIKVVSIGRKMYSPGSREWAWCWMRHLDCEEPNLKKELVSSFISPPIGWSNIVIPDKQTLVTDAGKLNVLDGLLKRLKQQGHRVLIYSQMTRMIDLLEEYMWFRKLTYMRLDGSSKISDRRDMVADFQNRTDIFVFLLSTRAGGLGINLTAADTVIFYDSDWNPTVDQQAMDRAHRLGQTKQVTVYRLICKGTIEERILQRAREKSEIQRMVISGGNFKPDTLKPKEVVSLLLDDAEIEQKYRQKQLERRLAEESRQDIFREKDRERKRKLIGSQKEQSKQTKGDEAVIDIEVPRSPSPIEGSTNLNGRPPLGLCDTETKSITHSTFPSRLNPAERVKARRGRPPRSLRPSLSRPLGLHHHHLSHMPTIALGSRARRPGRPRLKPCGPGHQGTRGGGSSGRSLPVPIPPPSSQSSVANTTCLRSQ